MKTKYQSATLFYGEKHLSEVHIKDYKEKITQAWAEKVRRKSKTRLPGGQDSRQTGQLKGG
jgi:hypothetical protein